jgi:hypothetical protein
MMIVNVLGTEYTIKKSDKVIDPTLENCDGYCDTSTKTIVIDTFKNYEGQLDALGNFDEYEKKVIRHELVHAFLYESGLSANSWAKDEEIVDWIAHQFPKLQNTFEQCKAL